MSRVDFEVPRFARRDRCRSCAAPVVFVPTAKGKPMPLDLNTIECRDGKEYAESHFAHCPQAIGWRKK